jgi:ABC-type branched-subunit amino acid transport system ATPase component
MSFFETKRLTKAFGGLVAVDDISFTVEESEICGLIGPNGSGKTTVFNLVTAYYPITSGTVHSGAEKQIPCPPGKFARRESAGPFR